MRESERPKVQSPREGAKGVHLRPADVDAEGGGGMLRGRGTGEVNRG